MKLVDTNAAAHITYREVGNSAFPWSLGRVIVGNGRGAVGNALVARLGITYVVGNALLLWQVQSVDCASWHAPADLVTCQPKRSAT